MRKECSVCLGNIKEHYGKRNTGFEKEVEYFCKKCYGKEFEVGDLIAEYMEDTIYLIVLTDVFRGGENFLGHGYIIGSDAQYDESEFIETPATTKEEESHAIDLNEAVLIEEDYLQLRDKR